MPNGMFNWTFDDVVDFLKEKGFRLNYINASHYFYVGSYKNVIRQVCVPFHGKTAIKPRTLKGIILQSGIPQKEWVS
jgi:predicted RNA binding protein YcfA (HicA-like mRNA interferase family)